MFCVQFYSFLLSSKNCMTVNKTKDTYQIMNAYFTLNTDHPSSSCCRNFLQRVLIATALIHSRIDYCNSLFLNLPSYQLSLNLPLLLLNPAPLLYAPALNVNASRSRPWRTFGRRGVGVGPMRTGGVRGHAVLRKTADYSGQTRSKSQYLWCKKCVIFACKTRNSVLKSNFF